MSHCLPHPNTHTPQVFTLHFIIYHLVLPLLILCITRESLLWSGRASCLSLYPANSIFSRCFNLFLPSLDFSVYSIRPYLTGCPDCSRHFKFYFHYNLQYLTRQEQCAPSICCIFALVFSGLLAPTPHPACHIELWFTF